MDWCRAVTGASGAVHTLSVFLAIVKAKIDQYFGQPTKRRPVSWPNQFYFEKKEPSHGPRCIFLKQNLTVKLVPSQSTRGSVDEYESTYGPISAEDEKTSIL